MKRELAWSHLSQQIHLFEDDVGDKGGRAGIYLRFCEQMSQVASTTPCICPFLIMFIVSYPCNVRQAVSNEKKPIPGFTSRLMKRWSCSIGLLRYLLCRSSQDRARAPAVFNSLRAWGYAAFCSTMMTRGRGVWEGPSALEKKGFAAWASRVALNRNSRVFLIC